MPSKCNRHLNVSSTSVPVAFQELISLSCSRMHSLRSLSLHNNLLTYLPREILSLVHLHELSLRGNPLVVRFVKEMTYDPPSLLELAGRTIKSRNIPYYPCDLPANLLRYLDLASKCPNPKCAGEILGCDIWNEIQAWFQCLSPLIRFSFQQASTLTHASATLNLWTSAGNIDCRSCTTCAPRSAPHPAAPTHRATQSRRTRAACRHTASRGCFWDSATGCRLTKLSVLGRDEPG